MSGRCTEVDALQPLEERIEELGGGEFLEVLMMTVNRDDEM